MNGSSNFVGSTTALMDPPKTHRFTKLNDKALLVFSIINFVLGLVSCVLHTAVLVPFTGGFSFSGYSSLDQSGHGLWAGSFFIVTGFLGYSASYKPTLPILIYTLVMSVFAMITSIAAATLAGIAGGEVYWHKPCSYFDYNLQQDVRDELACNVWEAIEFSMLGVCVLALINNIVVLSLTSAALCCSGKRQPPQTTHYIVPNTSSQGPWVSNQLVYPYAMQMVPNQVVQGPQPQVQLVPQPYQPAEARKMQAQPAEVPIMQTQSNPKQEN